MADHLVHGSGDIEKLTYYLSSDPDISNFFNATVLHPNFTQALAILKTKEFAYIKMQLANTLSAIDFIFSKRSSLLSSITTVHKETMKKLVVEYAKFYLDKLIREKDSDQVAEINQLLRTELMSLSEDPDVKALVLAEIANVVVTTYWQTVPIAVIQKPLEFTREELLAKYPPKDDTYLHLAAAKLGVSIENYKRIFAKLIELSPTLFKEQLTKINGDGIAPMHIAVKARNTVFVQAVVEFGTEKKILTSEVINCKNIDGYTPLLYTVVLNTPQIAALLVAHGASPDLENKDHVTARMLATQQQRTEFLPLFSQRQRDVVGLSVSRTPAEGKTERRTVLNKTP